MKGVWLFLCSLILILMVFCGCHQKSDKISTKVVQNPNSANGQTAFENLPVFEFKHEEHDFGKVIQGEVVTFGFVFTNTGKSDLVISSVSTSCGCTVTKYPKEPIDPGHDGYINVTFNSEGRKGYQNKTVTVLANTQPNTKILRITAQVVVVE